MDLSLNQLIFRVFHEKDNALQPLRDELGLGRGQPRILSYLHSYGPATQNMIASYFRIDPAAVSRMTESLRKNGFLTRTENVDCRRSNRLELTEKGREAAIRWTEECAKLDDQILTGFTEEESAVLHDLLQRLLENLQREDCL
ncbi:MAG: winged helix-turn-helix transcriptional regulator [Spirochaetes bacterium]|uniref:Winged helix-turn-helix transcriptional regulator n=1 Tax=Candidatus Ornithospirochaeta stercoripullorum TaxID=2840899 RepID=A0A9D9H2T8_9SPIO|nr:winged helix-turn-helix transcriptional regulator [Candidatus Ornithospirochaeta stercoripullorum]